MINARNIKGTKLDERSPQDPLYKLFLWKRLVHGKKKKCNRSSQTEAAKIRYLMHMKRGISGVLKIRLPEILIAIDYVWLLISVY